MSAPQTFQLPPSSAFTEPQRRELNALFARIAQATNILFGSLTERPDPGLPPRWFVQTDAAGPHLYLDAGTSWYTVV